ncbi:type III pantothenate kinase [Prochlorococcus marinus]|uniref:type III pantothenate kinase n=1 Tax=Prochlorococcus marinus TaxID=1219 RepID=UPI0022B2F9BF|nr:type III pantothenate kinase [Prochlorococcus marinus]
MNTKKHCLLIGNSRWHWAVQKNEHWHFTHTAPDINKINNLKTSLWKWAAVGPIPKSLFLNPSQEVQIADIPLLKPPKWLGVDRALASWAAFTKAKSKNLHSKGLLVADAGTILSLTKITSKGEFAGGQLVAGLTLQRSAIAYGAEKLNPVTKEHLPNKKFPTSTEEAILRGSFQALLGTLLEAQKDSQMPLWLCGGNSKELFEALKMRNLEVYHFPNLVLEGMVNVKNLN